MTKKELILKKSLELFSSKGFKATSTRSIAVSAKVSEGLIFKHFKSKNGLLLELLKIGASKSTPEIQKIKSSDDPKSVISSCIKLFLNIKKEDLKGITFEQLLFYLKNIEPKEKQSKKDCLIQLLDKKQIKYDEGLWDEEV